MIKTTRGLPLELTVNREDAGVMFTYGIERKGAPSGGPSRDFQSYFFKTRSAASQFRDLENLHVGLPYIGGYIIISSDIRDI